ncbi:PREDICTED: uncharacterized protein LOC109149839 isoform X1 [Ipomoea nil]|uniref:uncharacterized protein LOC109149839 isoform X1 n=1 Tax=Ipomoea nil TaxID=35883 RepID=UPI000900E648|nr:PREDICTED: uncharacterized protein LOC109149839 isoform X1 [Ipomoea nil]
MGNCLPSQNEPQTRPIDSAFKLPSPLPTWPSSSGGEFGSGYIDLGGLHVCQISAFKKVWVTYEGGPDNLGATIFEPSSIPDGFSVLGYYGQPNNQPLFGWVLVGKDNSTGADILKPPSDYTLVWSSEALKINQTTPAYIWLPVPPEGYKAVGHVVTTSPEKPPADKIRCVREDFTDNCEVESWVWGLGSSSDPNGFNVNSLRPSNRDIEAQGVPVGTFAANIDGSAAISLSCLKNNNFTTFSSMPNLAQIEALFREYSPVVYFHPEETYLTSSVNWYFASGALLYTQGDESNPVAVNPDGENLPQGGSNDGTYWLDLPVDETAKETVKKGDLKSTEVYLHVKPMLGGTFTDIVVWLFYPFNGPATAKLGILNIPLGRTGEHIGDWEHLTLRISNFTGVLYRMYFSAHSSGAWVDTRDLEFSDGGNKPVAYASRNGHANYSAPGVVLQGPNDEIGIRNDTAKSNLVLECGAKYSVVAAPESVVEPAWLNYRRKWGPHITYELKEEVEKVEGILTGGVKDLFQSLVNILPNELFEEDGPTGPKEKNFWAGDER